MLKVANIEDNILNFYPIIQNMNSLFMEDKNCGDDSSMVPLDYGHLCGTIIDDNIYLSSNKIP